MADNDSIQNGKNFGIGIPQQTQGFFLKGASHLDWGMKDRLSRIFNPQSGRTVMLAFDHGYIMGPTSGLERLDLTIVPLIEYADCIMCARGALRSIVPPLRNKPISLRYSAGSTVLTDLNDECIMDIEEAIRLNASILAVMVAVGDPAHEGLTIRNLTKTIDQGTKFGIPTMGVTAVGKNLVRDARYAGGQRLLVAGVQLQRRFVQRYPGNRDNCLCDFYSALRAYAGVPRLRCPAAGSGRGAECRGARAPEV